MPVGNPINGRLPQNPWGRRVWPLRSGVLTPLAMSCHRTLDGDTVEDCCPFDDIVDEGGFTNAWVAQTPRKLCSVAPMHACGLLSLWCTMEEFYEEFAQGVRAVGL